MSKGMKYLEIMLKTRKPKTNVWGVLNKSSHIELGEIKWHSAWRQYCYFPTIQQVLSAGCMDDIGQFINDKMAERKHSTEETK